VQESQKTEFQIERFGSRRFGGHTILFRSFWSICGIFEWLEALVQKNMGPCKVWEFFGDFGGFL
jgi:hypothetical protein